MGTTKVHFKKSLKQHLSEHQERHSQWNSGNEKISQTTEQEGEMMTMSMDRQGERNLLISQSRKKATQVNCDWISFKSTSRSIELAVLISKEWDGGVVSIW